MIKNSENDNKETKIESSQIRILPQSLDAEQKLLSAILTNNKAYEKVSEFLKPIHFANDAHAEIFAACSKLIERGQLADPITLKDYFSQNKKLEEIGGFEYIMNVTSASVTIINAEDYGKIVFDRYIRREMIALGSDIVNDAFIDNLESSAETQIETAEKRLYELSDSKDSNKGLIDFSKALNVSLQLTKEALQREGGLVGVSTGFIDLDKKLGGLHDSDLLILAGRPGMGKTALATNIAYNAAESFAKEAKDKGTKAKSVAFFSLEMSSDQLASRILSAVVEVSSHKMRTGDLEMGEFGRLAAAVREIENMPLLIDDTPGLTVSNIRTRARRIKREKNLGLIIIDYLQLISSGNNKSDNRVQEISEITRGLKLIAKELGVPVICLSQLNRGVEQREEKRPLLSDLRESGSIEQDADVVMFVYREVYYLEHEEPKQRATENEEKFNARIIKWEEDKILKKNLAEVIIAKQRHGPIGTIKMRFDGEFTRFDNLAADDENFN